MLVRLQHFFCLSRFIDIPICFFFVNTITNIVMHAFKIFSTNDYHTPLIRHNCVTEINIYILFCIPNCVIYMSLPVLNTLLWYPDHARCRERVKPLGLHVVSPHWTFNVGCVIMVKLYTLPLLLSCLSCRWVTLVGLRQLCLHVYT